MTALLQAVHHDLPGGYGVALLQSALALIGICLLAWVVLRWFSGRLSQNGAHAGAIHVLERVSLDARRQLYLVRCGERVLLVGANDGAALTLIAEINPSTLPEQRGDETKSVGATLKNLATQKLAKNIPENAKTGDIGIKK